MSGAPPKERRRRAFRASLSLVALLAALLAAGAFDGWIGAWHAARADRAVKESAPGSRKPLARALPDLAQAFAAVPASGVRRTALRDAALGLAEASGADRVIAIAPRETLPRLEVAAAIAAVDPAAAARLGADVVIPEPRVLRRATAKGLRDAGLLLARAGRCDAAAAFREELLARGASSAYLERETARCRIDAGEVAAGLELLEASAQRHPRSRWTHVRLAEARLAANDVEGAAAAARRATELDAELEDAWELLGRVRRRAGRPLEAASAFARAAELRPQALGPALLRVESLLDGAAFAAAEPATAALVERFGGSFHAWLLRGRALRGRKRHDEAHAAFDRAAAIRPQAFGPALFRVESRLDGGRLDDAAAESQSLVSRFEGSYHAWYLRGRVLRARREHEAAVAAFDRALALDPGSVGARLEQAESLFELGRVEEARPLVDAVTAEAPHVEPAWYLRGRVLRGLGLLEEARESFERALALDPRSLWADFFLTETLFDLGETGIAERRSTGIVERSPAFYYGWHLRARVLERLERPAAAAESYRRALALRPQNVWLRTRIEELEAAARG